MKHSISTVLQEIMNIMIAVKTYTVNIDSYGMFQITEINIH